VGAAEDDFLASATRIEAEGRLRHVVTEKTRAGRDENEGFL
jgi:hypothetical protein